MDYQRPKTLEQALEGLRAGQPLAGGTGTVPHRLRVRAVVDVQDLGMDRLEAEGDRLVIGASARLQALVDSEAAVPQALRQACRHEAALNLRNMATLAGTVVGGDGRSPVLAVMLALGAEARLEPGGERWTVEHILERRGAGMRGRLITAFALPAVRWSAYAQVGRAPMDRPLVCAAAVRRADGTLGLALGGFGARPLPLEGADLEQAARQAYAGAGDAWAGAAYRAHVSGVLVRRLLAQEAG